MTIIRKLTAALVAVVLVASGARAGASTVRALTIKPIDYSKITGLSQPVYKNFAIDSTMLTMADGVKLYIEMTRPADKGRYPVITEISPYHGTVYKRDGVRMLPKEDGLVGYFPPRGYAVAMVDVRGTGRSGGCLDLMGPKDQSDAKIVIEWLASRPWSNGRVGVIGHSYPAGTSVMALAEHPKGLATAVVSAGLGTMYEHQYQAGVPYNLQVIGPTAGYSFLTVERHMPLIGLPGLGSGTGGDDLGNNTSYAACGFNTSPFVEGAEQLSAVDQLSGRFAPWHAVRDFRAGAATSKVPVFVIHGVNDNAARVAALDWFLRRNNPSDKLWLGQWDHGAGCCPNRRGWQWTSALHAWFDKQLQGRHVDTGPPFEAFLADADELSAIEGARTEIYAAKRFNAPSRELTLYPGADGGLSTSQRPPGSVSFAGTPLGYFANGFTQGAAFSTAAMRRDTLLLGVPKLRLAASVTVPRVYLIATLFDEDGDGNQRRISQFAINPELRDGIRTVKVVVPGRKYVMSPPGFAVAHHLRKGHKLVLRVTTSDPDKAPFFSVDPHISVYTGAGNTALTLPVVDDPTTTKDTFTLKQPRRS